MSNALINVNELGIGQQTEEQQKAIAELTKAGSYLPQLRIYGGNNEIVKEGKFPVGHFGLYYSRDKVVDLNTDIDVLVVAFRPRASIIMSDENPINYYDIASGNFVDTKDKAVAKVQGYQAGLEYLIYISNVEEFAMFFMGSPTLRRESDNVKAAIGHAVTLKIKFIKTNKFSWHGCETLKCDVPFNIPDGEIIKETYDKYFAKPKDSEVNVAPEGEEARAR
jgi:hypothetical protein